MIGTIAPAVACLAGAAIGGSFSLGCIASVDRHRRQENEKDYRDYMTNRTKVTCDGEKIWDSVSGCCGSATWID